MNPNNFNYNPSFNPNYNSDDRLIGGGFAFPFLLGGVTGAALAPSFWGGYNRPYYNNYYYPYPPRPYPYPRPFPRPY